MRDKIIYNQSKIVENEDIFTLTCENPLPGNKLFDANLIRQNALEFADVKIGQDLNFFIKFLLKSKKVNLINDSLFKYRIVLNGISRTYSFKILDIVNSFKDIRNYYFRNNNKEIYEEYVSIAELLHYNGQMSKLTRFSKRLDRKIILLFFRKYAREIKFKKTSFYKKNKNYVYKFHLKQFFGILFVSKFNYIIYNKLFEFRERNNLKKF